MADDLLQRLDSIQKRLAQFPAGDVLTRDELLADLRAFRQDLARVLPEPPAPERPRIEGLKLEGLCSNSAALVPVLATLAAVAPTRLAVLLEGETGTGKELFARIVHANSGRSKFVAVNCGAFPSGLIESELFGHVKGAFTGASADRKGKFEEAHEGTLFLDEIGELEPFAQVKLLRVLEVGEIQRVGSDTPRKVDVRIVAATNRDLDEMVRQGKFREDLYYRINMCPLYLPPLRERRGDIPLLLDRFLRDFAAQDGKPVPVVDPELRHFLCNIYDYKGNVRELRNIAQFIASVSGPGRAIERTDLPLRISGDPLSDPAPAQASVPIGARATKVLAAERNTGSASVPLPGGTTDGTASIKGRTAILRQAEQQYWITLLKKHRGSIQKISEETNLSPSRIYQILERCRLKPKDFR